MAHIFYCEVRMWLTRNAGKAFHERTAAGQQVFSGHDVETRRPAVPRCFRYRVPLAGRERVDQFPDGGTTMVFMLLVKDSE